MYYLAWLRLHGVPIRHHARLLHIEGEQQVEAVVWRRQRQDQVANVSQASMEEQRIECDALGFGYALRSETQLADLLGCKFTYQELHRAHLPTRDAAGRSSQPGVYLAGDGAGIMGADAAELAGERAALALLEDRGVAIDGVRAMVLEQQLAQIGRFRLGLERAFPFPQQWAQLAEDELVVCRCEQITAGQLRQAATELGVMEMNRLKALTRVGMGRCQGRICGVAAAEILAQASSVPLAQVGRLRGQAPIKPLPLDMHIADGTEAEHAAH